jgi:hypothetical protein
VCTLLQVAPACNIFARASPENKLRIVRALQHAAPAKAAAAVARAAEQGKNLAAVSRDLVTKSQELASTSRGVATTSGATSPDVMVNIDLTTTSYGSSVSAASRPGENLRWDARACCFLLVGCMSAV